MTTLGPGRNLDALIAHHVFGYEFRDISGMTYGVCSNCGRSISKRDFPRCSRGECLYSTDDDAAWAVVRAMKEKDYAITICEDDIAFKVIEHAEELYHSRYGFAHAVCLAALRAVGASNE